MGCWNETCGITQMPIEGGDPVRLFLLVENKIHGYARDHVMHYSTDLWRPFGLPLKGTYDEYGGLENIQQDAMSDFLLESLKNIVVEVPNRMGDTFKRAELDWPTAINFLTDEGLNVTDPYHIGHLDRKLNEILAKAKELVPDLPDNGWSVERSDMSKEQNKVVHDDPKVIKMYHMMVHEDIYQAFMNYTVPAERFSCWTDGNLKEELYADAAKHIAEFREHLKEKKELTDALDIARYDSHKRFFRMDSRNRFVSLCSYSGSYASSYLSKYLDFVEKRIEEGAADDDPQIKMLTDQIIEFGLFGQSMSLLRKLWMPQTGKGGQDREYTLHKYLGQAIVDFSEKKIKAWDEMCDDDDIEEGTPEDSSEENDQE